MPAINGIWVVPTGGEAGTAGELAKRESSKVYLAFDFGNLPEIAAGDTLGSVTLDISTEGDGDLPTATPDDPGSAVMDLLGQRGDDEAPYRAAAWFEGGEAGTYVVECTATLESGAVVVASGTLTVV